MTNEKRFKIILDSYSSAETKWQVCDSRYNDIVVIESYDKDLIEYFCSRLNIWSNNVNFMQETNEINYKQGYEKGYLDGFRKGESNFWPAPKCVMKV